MTFSRGETTMSDLYVPDDPLKRSIRQKMDAKETRELLEIYAAHDTSSWIPAAFDIVRDLLLERGIDAAELPYLTPARIHELAGEEDYVEARPVQSIAEDEPQEAEETSSRLSMAQKATLYQTMLDKTDDELAEIYSEHDTGRWVPEAFSIIRDVLLEHGYSEEELHELSPEPVMNENGTYNLTPAPLEKRYITHPSTPKEIKKAVLWQRLNALETEELLNIYAAHDSESWTPLAFAVVRDILIARGWPKDEIDNLILDTQPEEDSTGDEEEENE